ncbi:hypothetical protein BWD121_015100 [Bartonella sp. WD12.1]|nr:hypothetical protein BWD121_015100 [Bartonella sp. WD12.1]
MDHGNVEYIDHLCGLIRIRVVEIFQANEENPV